MSLTSLATSLAKIYDASAELKTVYLGNNDNNNNNYDSNSHDNNYNRRTIISYYGSIIVIKVVQ